MDNKPTVGIRLVCPECGSYHWILPKNPEAEGAFLCAGCGELSFPEDMEAKVEDYSHDRM